MRYRFDGRPQKPVSVIMGDESCCDARLQCVVDRLAEIRSVERQQILGRVVGRSLENDAGQLGLRTRSNRRNEH